VNQSQRKRRTRRKIKINKMAKKVKMEKIKEDYLIR